MSSSVSLAAFSLSPVLMLPDSITASSALPYFPWDSTISIVLFLCFVLLWMRSASLVAGSVYGCLNCAPEKSFLLPDSFIAFPKRKSLIDLLVSWRNTLSDSSRKGRLMSSCLLIVQLPCFSHKRSSKTFFRAETGPGWWVFTWSHISSNRILSLSCVIKNLLMLLVALYMQAANGWSLCALKYDMKSKCFSLIFCSVVHTVLSMRFTKCCSCALLGRTTSIP